MSDAEVRREGLAGTRPGREALTGSRGGWHGGRQGGGGRGEQAQVPPAEFSSYYGRPVIKAPVWASRDIAGYFVLGGVAGGSAVLAGLADLTGRGELRRLGRYTASGAALVSLAALVHDLGMPSRFLHMLRVVKVTSPMSVGTWALSAFAPATAVAAAAELSDVLPLPAPVRRVTCAAGRPAGLAAAAIGPFVMTYTGALVADTAVPVWHDARRELPYLFGASAAAASGGVLATLARPGQSGPARWFGVLGAVADIGLTEVMRRRLGMVAEPLSSGRAGRWMRLGSWGSRVGTMLLAGGVRNRPATVAGGVAVLVGSVGTKFGVFHAGVASAKDPRYTVVPQRERLDGAGPPAPA